MWGDEQGESGRTISIVMAEATWMALEATGSNMQTGNVFLPVMCLFCALGSIRLPSSVGKILSTVLNYKKIYLS